ncbi:glycosyltransferase family 2 protein [Paenibacillus sp.]|uniref:glycosyltransferase family 2 protein n=1 Tax=Paenibacillus sp. TaxID=58172 RepID=UPI002D6B99B5|nr:glycosyltransferase family 2 protein [Paenibacillus sp.]HZG56477.1 glycosyltransferase family 2 protein [Paenibacillus sp.]
MMNGIVLVVQIGLFAVGLYQLVLSFWGLRIKKEKREHAPRKTFAVLVAAHNEEQVVGALVDNLKALDYPRELYDVFVICDNCTDRTADVVRAHGAIAMERRNDALRGKGFAIEWMLKELWSMEREYDAVVMFDADNLVSPQYLREMNNDLCNGSRVIQAYLDTKNPVDSWITASYGVTYWFCNRLWQMPRRALGMANFLGGTGMCFETKLLQEMGWGATSLVEDLEFTMRCVQRGVYPTFNYDAKVYDEKPLTFQASARQRLRWMQGHFDVARRYFFPLLWAGIKERKWTKIDTALYSISVYNVFISLVFTVVMWFDELLPGKPTFLSVYDFVPVWVGGVALIVVYMQFPLALALEKVRNWKMYASLLAFPLFLLSWYPITFHAFFTQNNKSWSHTKHTRVLRLDDVQKF